MPAPVSIRADRSPAELRRLAGEMPDRQLGTRLAALAIALGTAAVLTGAALLSTSGALITAPTEP